MPIAIIAVVVIALIGVGAFLFSSDEVTPVPDQTETDIARTDDTPPTSNDTNEDAEVTESNEDTASDDIADGAATPYTATATYLTPARTEHEIDVTLNIDQEGTIVGADIVYDNGAGYSNPHQERFDNSYREAVIGQNIENIDLAITGGASLTTGAFNEVITEIETERS